MPVVLVHNTELEPCDLSSGQWLEKSPRGAYTTARTVDRDLVFQLHLHIGRLAKTANMMISADAKAAGHLSEDIPPIDGDGLRPLVINSMRLAVHQLQQLLHPNSCEVKLTLLLTWDLLGSPDLYCHAEPLPPRPTPPVKLQVRGLPRENARAKDSEWVRQRKVLESAKPPDVNELLLATADGCLLEGLSSNFFILDSAGSVVTADEGVLCGTVRQLILEVCADEDVPVRLQPPQLSDIHSWQGAFISSTSRLLLPVCEVQYLEAGSLLCKKVFEEQHPLVLMLEAKVMAKVQQHSEQLDSHSCGRRTSAADAHARTLNGIVK